MTAPAAGGAALRRCVACDQASFADQHWGRSPLLSRAADLPRDFADLFSAVAVDELVSERGLRTPFLRMAKQGSVLPAARFTRGGGAGASIGDQAADDRILSRMDDGATLVLQALHRSWPPLVRFGSALSDELGHPVQINAYITPPQNQGFAPHYDVHDVFVLQVAGRKRWTLHAPPVPDPLASQSWEEHRDEVAAAAQGEPLLDTVLEPGDALYLPRGTVHSAVALGQTSIHLTVGVHPITRYDLVRHLLELAQDSPELRASLPMGVDLADVDTLAAHLAAVVAALRDYLDDAPAAEVARRVGTDLMSRTRPEPIGPLAQLSAAESVGPETPLRRRAGLRLRTAQTVDGVVLTLLDRTLTVPVECADAVKTVLAGGVVRPAELPGLDESDGLVLVRRLLREGVLVPA